MTSAVFWWRSLAASSVTWSTTWSDDMRSDESSDASDVFRENGLRQALSEALALEVGIC